MDMGTGDVADLPVYREGTESISERWQLDNETNVMDDSVYRTSCGFMVWGNATPPFASLARSPFSGVDGD